MNLFQDVNSIQSEKTKRYRTGWADIDWVFGSNLNDPLMYIGLPAGALTLMGGEAGVGKTRLCVSLMSSLIDNGFTVFYNQLEMTSSQFRSQYMPNKRFPVGKFLVSDECFTLDQQLEALKQIRPQVAIIDSVNRIEGFNGGHGADDIQRAFREIAPEIGCHVIFLAHLTVDGKIKGGTNLPHMGDIVTYMTRFDTSKTMTPSPKNCIKIQVGKTRFGKSDLFAIARHTNEGVECISANHLVDGNFVLENDFHVASVKQNYSACLLAAAAQQQGLTQEDLSDDGMQDLNEDNLQQYNKSLGFGNNFVQKFLNR